jgi:hypothetical protein
VDGATQVVAEGEADAEGDAVAVAAAVAEAGAEAVAEAVAVADGVPGDPGECAVPHAVRRRRVAQHAAMPE